MPPELAPAILNLVWPLLGVMATGLLSLLSWIGHRTYQKLDDLCKALAEGQKQAAELDRRMSCIETRCRIFHKED